MRLIFEAEDDRDADLLSRIAEAMRVRAVPDTECWLDRLRRRFGPLAFTRPTFRRTWEALVPHPGEVWSFTLLGTGETEAEAIRDALFDQNGVPR